MTTPLFATQADVGMKPRILLVEDDANLVELVSYNLEKEGFDVTTTHDGEEALVLAEEARPRPRSSSTG